MFSRISLVATFVWCTLLAGALTSPTPVVRPKAVRVRQEADEPQSTACGDIIDSVNGGYAYFYATDAYDCLTSVPFNSAVATRFVDYINTTVQFQSTLAYLKNPPSEYQQPAVNVLAGLQSIKNNVTKGVYKNQYQFEIDLQHLLYQTHDAHLYLTAGITAAFSFLAPFSITAASPDGKALPKVYITNDIIKSRNESWTPSPIKTINDQDAVEYLGKVASLNSFGGLEAHADWNQLFAMPGLNIRGERSIWDGYINFFPGDEIKLVVENGTDYLDYWLALYNEPYATGPLTTGGDFYNYFVLGLLPDSFNASDGFYNAAYAVNETSTDSDTTPAANSWREITYEAYPDPDVAQDGLALLADGVVSGYFLRDVGAAVLSLPSFGQTGYSIGNFSSAVSYFIGNVTEANLTRVVIDLQQNTGGTVELAFSTFKRFFPDIDPFAASRRRSHQLGNTLGEAYTAYFNDLEIDDPSYEDFVADEWVITSRLNAATGQNFTSWAEYYDPNQANGDSFSLNERYNLSSYVFDAALFEGWIPWGYTPENPADDGRPFDAENIVLLTDGACSSTCALLVEMFTQAGVKTIVAGGAPTTGPMQAVGGNRGAALYSADGLDRHLNQLSSLSKTDDAVLASVPQLLDTGYRDSGVYTTVLGVNLRDQIRGSDPVPLQFKYEAADCRIFYTLGNVYNMSRLWRDAVSAAFDDRSLCVEGSTGYSNSSKLAPTPPSEQSVAPDFDFGEPDSVLIGDDFDLSGGLQGESKAARSNQITLCTSSCAINARCRNVLLSSCKSPGVRNYFKRCVPITEGQSYCPADTTWEKETLHSLKGSTNAQKKGYFATAAQQFWTGPCTPRTQSALYCADA
ncbi:Nn.00g039690.m01.CDS01 [Neocucurbitaria sp. VM-36]